MAAISSYLILAAAFADDETREPKILCFGSGSGAGAQVGNQDGGYRESRQKARLVDKRISQQAPLRGEINKEKNHTKLVVFTSGLLKRF